MLTFSRLPASPSGPTTPLEAFRKAYFGHPELLPSGEPDEVDVACLDRLGADDRQLAEAELLDALRQRTPDPRPVVGLGHLGTRAALPLLHDALPGRTLRVLQAIARIDPAALDHARVVGFLRSEPLSWALHIDLPLGLSRYFTPEQVGPTAVAALLALLAHPEPLVRYHNLNALRQLHSLPDDDELTALLTYDPRPEAHQQGQQRLQAQIEARLRPAE